MALRDPRLALTRALALRAPYQIRLSSTVADQSPLNDLAESTLTVAPSEEQVKSFDPIEYSRKRPRLPSSRYKYRPPKYDRGPMHPIQPLPPSHIASREFAPGPFSFPRLQETYQATIAPDILTMLYTHIPPGAAPVEPVDRMRHWVGESPYYKNRTPKGPRGREVLLPLRKPVKVYNIPGLTKVILHAHVAKATSDTRYLHAASLAIQSVTNVRCEVHRAKRSVAEWEAKKGRWTSLTATMEGENMYHFLAKLIEIVMPRIKEWKGVSGTAGDETGNITCGLTPEEFALFPEIEHSYDMYPQDMLPGCHITICTSAPRTAEARLLLSALGVPFDGKMKR